MRPLIATALLLLAGCLLVRRWPWCQFCKVPLLP
ncbi:hypothetical protein LCGC14_2700990, partial [marine sediment metagenome]